MRMEQLIWFATYMRLKSLTEAGKQLHISSQAIYIAMKRLEDELDAKLFVKTADGLAPTESGRALLNLCGKFIPEYIHFLDRLSAIKKRNISELKGSLTIYSNLLFNHSFLPSLLQNFSVDNPGIKVNIFENESVNIFREFSSGGKAGREAKIAFCQRPLTPSPFWTPHPDFVFNTIFKGPFYACAHPASDLPAKSSLKTLMKHPVVLYASHQSSLGSHDKECRSPLLTAIGAWGNIDIAFSVNSLEMWRATILARRCIGFVHSFLVRWGKDFFDGLKLISIKEEIVTELGWITPRKENPIIEAIGKRIVSHMTFPAS